MLLEVKRSRYGISVRLGSKATDFEFLELALVLSSGEEEEEEESEFLLLPEEDDRYAFFHAPSIRQSVKNAYLKYHNFNLQIPTKNII